MKIRGVPDPAYSLKQSAEQVTELVKSKRTTEAGNLQLEELVERLKQQILQMELAADEERKYGRNAEREAANKEIGALQVCVRTMLIWSN
jgi:hypothetical protein